MSPAPTKKYRDTEGVCTNLSKKGFGSTREQKLKTLYFACAEFARFRKDSRPSELVQGWLHVATSPGSEIVAPVGTQRVSVDVSGQTFDKIDASEGLEKPQRTNRPRVLLDFVVSLRSLSKISDHFPSSHRSRVTMHQQVLPEDSMIS